MSVSSSPRYACRHGGYLHATWLKEELDYSPEAVSYFASLKFDFERLGASRCVRLFYEVQLPPVLYKLAALTLAEGHSMAPLEIADLPLSKRVVPYDSFAIWRQSPRGYGRDLRFESGPAQCS